MHERYLLLACNLRPLTLVAQLWESKHPFTLPLSIPGSTWVYNCNYRSSCVSLATCLSSELGGVIGLMLIDEAAPALGPPGNQAPRGGGFINLRLVQIDGVQLFTATPPCHMA